MTLRPLIVMALESEGSKALAALGFEVLCCGVGKVNASYHLTRRLARMQPGEFSYVLNLGSAGSPRFAHDTLVAADHFVQRDMDATGIGFAYGETPFEDAPPMLSFEKQFPQLLHGICGSGDSFLQGPPPLPCDIIDMEAYALAKVCRLERIPFACVKYITDGADGTADVDWQTNLHRAEEAFSQLMCDF